MPKRVGYQVYEDDGSARVSPLPFGTRVTRIMEPKLQAAANFANGDEFVTFSTGVRAYRVTVLAAPAGEAVIVAHSTAASDAAALKTAVDAVTTVTTGEWDTPDGVALTNMIAVVAAAPRSDWICADDDALIKSIGMQQTGGTLSLVLLETIE